ncbi:sigma-70 family RNA polymerase sigma factor [candidate division KSB1 bacterium]|nr:sigma-70 family RNA polymerase sigma factor [candidate division KSB1 bacterium]
MTDIDEIRFTEWWTHIESAIFTIGRKYLRSTDAAQDLAQDVAISALLKFSSFRDRDHFEAWTLTRARWLALDRLHFKRLEKSPVDALTDSATPEDTAQLSEILEIISRFPQNQKTALLMTYEGHTTSEIAAELGVKPATVRSLKRHARYRLFKELAA